MNIELPIVKCIKGQIAAAKSIDQLTVMNLSKIKTAVIPHEAKKLLEKCTHLYELQLSDCGLQSLDNLPELRLTNLLVEGNQLKDLELNKLTIYRQSLEILTLSKNHIQSITNLTLFRHFPYLSELNLKDNPLCTQYVSYSRKIFDQILYPNEQLTIIDCYLRNGEIMSDGEGDAEDQPDWMIEQEDSSSRSGNQGSIEQQKSISSDQNGPQKIDANMISLYQQYQYVNPSHMVDLLNQHEEGLAIDPLDNNYAVNIPDGDYQDQMQESEMDIEQEVETEGSKCVVSKKVKYNEKMDEDDFEY